MASVKLKSQRKTNNMNTDFAQNTMKLRRILDKMPNATEEEVRAEYIRQGGLLNKEENLTGEGESVVLETKEQMLKVVKNITKQVKKTVKKVTKKK